MVKIVKTRGFLVGGYNLVMTKKEAKEMGPKGLVSGKYYVKLFGRRMPVEIVSEEEYDKLQGEVVG